MTGGGATLHWSLLHERVLFASIVLDSFKGFFLASILVVALCTGERFLTHLLSKRWAPTSSGLYRTRLALWRTLIYALATFLRLCYMLIAMTLHIGLILLIVASLSISQFAIELISLPKPAGSPVDSHERRDSTHSAEPLLSGHQREQQSYPLTSRSSQSRRSRSKPDNIFIHPAESNIARADAVAIELGLGGETERVKNFNIGDDSAWETGTGQNKARELMKGSQTRAKSDKADPFFAEDDSDSD